MRQIFGVVCCNSFPFSFDWPTTVFQCFDAVGWVIWPVKIVPDMSYNVFGGTLNPTLLLLSLICISMTSVHGVQRLAALVLRLSSPPLDHPHLPLLKAQITYFDMHHPVSEINFTFHSVSLVLTPIILLHIRTLPTSTLLFYRRRPLSKRILSPPSWRPL